MDLKRIAIAAAAVLIASVAIPADRPAGDPVQGHKSFTKLRCDSCHSLSSESRKTPHPLPDLTAQPPDALAESIVARGDLRRAKLFDEMVMSQIVSQMSDEQIADIVAYLRQSAEGG